MQATSSAFRVIDTSAGRHLFLTDGSRLFELQDGGLELTETEIGEILRDQLPRSAPRIDGTPLAPPPLQTLSLNVAQACNMSCDYCYAGKGTFGGKARMMSAETARLSVDRLMFEAQPGAEVVVGFMGGEPLLNRKLLHEIVPYAARKGELEGRKVRFSITTNATLVEPDDARLFAEYAFQVAVSIDGDKFSNDALRSLHKGTSSYDRIVASLAVLERHGRPRHLSARMTIGAGSRDLASRLEHVFALGFDSAGFSPVLTSPDPALELRDTEFAILLNEMRECGRRAEAALLERKRYPFSNYETALQQIARGTHRPYACGAGAAYLSVNADGDLFACHRFVDDDDHAFGDILTGSDRDARARYLAKTHVDTQEPCKACWARYLCGGGCQHEVERRGRPSCDYIRGWLEFCLASYCLVSERAAGYFHNADDWFGGSTFGR